MSYRSSGCAWQVGLAGIAAFVGLFLILVLPYRLAFIKMVANASPLEKPANGTIACPDGSTFTGTVTETMQFRCPSSTVPPTQPAVVIYATATPKSVAKPTLAPTPSIDSFPTPNPDPCSDTGMDMDVWKESMEKQGYEVTITVENGMCVFRHKYVGHNIPVPVESGMCTVTQAANLHSGPSTEFPVISTVVEGQTFATFGQLNGWYKLSNNTWISGDICIVTNINQGNVFTQTLPFTMTSSVAITGTAPYSYTPGGESFGAWATDVIQPDRRNDCGRLWQATNGQNLPWTAIICGWKASNPAPKLQWPHATQLTISGDGTIEFDLYRDMGAISQMKERGQTGGDPYLVANAKNEKLGLGWFVQGFNGTACIDGVCQSLDGGGVFQLGFPKVWTGHHHVVITVQSGQAQFWQGEKLSSVDTWPAN
ncbi:hypothetical protein BH09PAT2_BH09PAT2_04980 [soil metagenome]